MTTSSAARPIFQNGQRLTAERLNDAVEFLRTMIRRTLLAPLSSGVAEGFHVSPVTGQQSGELVIEPGLAIDGKGRLIIVTRQQRFTAQQIAAAAGLVLPADEFVRVCIAIDDSSQSTNPCDPQLPLTVVEDFKLIFTRQDVTTALSQVFANFEEPNCVKAWDKLDPPTPTSDDCCVTLGHVHFVNPTTIEATNFFRQGVAPRFNVIRNTDGTPSIFLAEAQFDPTPLGPVGEPISTEASVGIPVTTFFGPKSVNFSGPIFSFGGAAFQTAGGVALQATHVAPFGVDFQTATVWPLDRRVFVLAGGSGPETTPDLGPAQSGASAVSVELAPSPLGPVDRSGLPLVPQIASTDVPRVERTNVGSILSIGLSAGPQVTFNGKLFVPVATSGIIKAKVTTTSFVPLFGGVPLTIGGADRLMVPDTVGQPIVARVATSPSTGSDPADIFVWVVHPPQRFEGF